MQLQAFIVVEAQTMYLSWPQTYNDLPALTSPLLGFRCESPHVSQVLKLVSDYSGLCLEWSQKVYILNVCSLVCGALESFRR